MERSSEAIEHELIEKIHAGSAGKEEIAEK